MTENWHQNFKSKNRGALIAAAKELFMEQSFLNVNIKDICSEAGISRVTFYKNFQSMNELVVEVQVEILEEMIADVKKAAAPGMNGRDMLAAMLDAWVKYASEHPGNIKFIVLFDLHFEAYNLSDSFKAYYNSIINRGKEQHFLMDALKAGVEDGTLKSNADSLNTAHFIFTAMMGLLQKMSIVSEENGGSNENDLMIIDRFVEMIIQHLSA